MGPAMRRNCTPASRRHESLRASCSTTATAFEDVLDSGRNDERGFGRIARRLVHSASTHRSLTCLLHLYPPLPQTAPQLTTRKYKHGDRLGVLHWPPELIDKRCGDLWAKINLLLLCYFQYKSDLRSALAATAKSNVLESSWAHGDYNNALRQQRCQRRAV